MTTITEVVVPAFGKGYVSFDTPSTINVAGNSATAFTVGRNGSSDYVFQVDTNTANAATGVKVTGAAAASGVAVAVISSGTDENLTLDAKGSGTVTINGTATGGITLARATSATVSLHTPALDGVAPTGAGLTIGAATTSKIGFYGHAVEAQQVLATGAAHTVDDVITFLQGIGLCKQS